MYVDNQSSGTTQTLLQSLEDPSYPAAGTPGTYGVDSVVGTSPLAPQSSSGNVTPPNNLVWSDQTFSIFFATFHSRVFKDIGVFSVSLIAAVVGVILLSHAQIGDVARTAAGMV